MLFDAVQGGENRGKIFEEIAEKAVGGRLKVDLEKDVLQIITVDHDVIWCSDGFLQRVRKFKEGNPVGEKCYRFQGLSCPCEGCFLSTMMWMGEPVSARRPFLGIPGPITRLHVFPIFCVGRIIGAVKVEKPLDLREEEKQFNELFGR